MGRAKQRMELISNEKTRFSTFQKRKKGLLKKAYELKTLCDVQLCVIIYGPQTDLRPVQPETLAANPDVIKRLMHLYRTQTAYDKSKKTFDISNFFEDRKHKIEDEINKLRKKNKEAHYTKWDPRYDVLSREQLLRMEHELERKITDAKEKVEHVKGSLQAIAGYYYSGQEVYGKNYLGLGCDNVAAVNPFQPGYEVYGKSYLGLGYDNVPAVNPGQPGYEVFGKNCLGLGYDNVPVVNPTNTMMTTVNDNYYQHQNHSYFTYNQQVMDQALASYDPAVMMMEHKNLSHFNNNFGHQGLLNGLDSQQVVGQWQYTQPQIGLFQMGFTHFYSTNPGQYDRST